LVVVSPTPKTASTTMKTATLKAALQPAGTKKGDFAFAFAVPAEGECETGFGLPEALLIEVVPDKCATAVPSRLIAA
jgi:hypothetical protein